MTRFLSFIFIIIIFSNSAYALVISEIVANPAGSDTNCEVVEVYNDEDKNYDISELEFFDSGISRDLKIGNNDNKILTKEYVLFLQSNFASSSCKWSYSGKYFISNFQLANTKENLSLRLKSGQELDNFKFDKDGVEGVKLEAKEDKSLSKINNVVVESNITLGFNNTLFVNPNVEQPVSTSGTTGTSLVEPVYYPQTHWPESEKIYVDAGENRIGLAGAEILFEGYTVTGEKMQVTDPKYFWSFGDGESSENKKTTHNYKFVGEYVATLEVSSNNYRGEDKVYVKIINPDLEIRLKEVENKKEKFVEITNNSKEEVDIGGFLIKSFGGEFENTFILPKKLLILPGKQINISQETLKLATSTNKVVLAFQNGREVINSEVLEKNSFKYQTATSSEKLSVMTKENYDKLKILKISTDDVKRNNVFKKSVVYPPGNSAKKEVKAEVKQREEVFMIENNKKNVLIKVLEYFGI